MNLDPDQDVSVTEERKEINNSPHHLICDLDINSFSMGFSECVPGTVPHQMKTAVRFLQCPYRELLHTGAGRPI